MTASRLLAYGRQEIDDADIAAVVETLRGDWLTGGPAVNAFEAALALATDAPQAVVCANGTAALHLAALAIIKPGDTVIVPAITFAATANAIRFVGGEVVFCDVDPRSGLATPASVAQAYETAARTPKSAFIVHLNGQTVDMVGVDGFARAYGLSVVEDSCHAIGATSRREDGTHTAIGSCRDSTMAVFSFHPVKTITSGEGGAITCRDPALASRLRSLRSHGITRDPAEFTCPDQAFDTQGAVNPWYYEMASLGYNYRITDIQCALGLSQLRRLSYFVGKRAELASAYDSLLAPLAPVVRPIHKSPHGTPALHLYVVQIDFATTGRSRAGVMRALREKGIGTQVHYLPVNRHPYYIERYGATPLPGADAYYERCLTLPLFPAMTHEDLAEVVDALTAALR